MTRPHVMMLLASGIDYDTRVKKEAVSLAKAGCLVTVVSRSSGDEQSISDLHGVRVIRQPVAPVLVAATHTGAHQFSWPWVRDRWRSGMTDRQALGYANAKVVAYQRLYQERLGVATTRGLRREYRKRLPATGPSARPWSSVQRFALRATLKLRWPMLVLTGAWPGKTLANLSLKRWSTRLGALENLDAVPKKTFRSWRRNLPYLLDTERAFGQYFDRFPPAVIHAHDFFTLPMAVHARRRLYARGFSPVIVYDSHEFVRGLGAHYPDHIFNSYVQIEDDYIREADAIVTVTEEIAERLVGLYGLGTTPTVVLNAPPLESSSTHTDKSIRKTLGLDTAHPLAVYIGSVNPNRGIDILIEAMAQIPSFDVAIVATRHDVGLQLELEERAEVFGVSQRFHFVDPVEPHLVVPFIRDADIGLIVSRNDVINHQVSLPNKLFEYLHAGLPIVTSNCAALEVFVTRTGVGEVFESGNADDLAKALETVLTDSRSYKSSISTSLLAEYSWESSQRSLIDLYSRVLKTDLDPDPEVPLVLEERLHL